MSSDRRKARAVHLLEKLLKTGWYDEATLAEELVMTPAMLAAFSSGRVPMPLDRQLVLALFVIEKVPPLARLGHQLRGQVRAAISFQAHETSTHSSAPSDIRIV
jgi:hypothetical protein